MQMVLDIASWALLVGGCAVCVIGGIGLHRMPDFYTRTHAASLTDTLGAPMVLVGLMLQQGLHLNSVKLLMVLVFLVMTSPVSGHALGKAAWKRGLRPKGLGPSLGEGTGRAVADETDLVMSGANEEAAEEDLT